ncbi:hypothetical protein ACIRBX_24755 [Kitasatospora sp. NPDC096147]|uniref:hypothetical protein n=1 Tax=Kitasatospora sp. NPDC096147 TaxID=3364093 RepID=UPI0037F2D4FA
MNATPQHQQADREELARLLPAAGDPALSRYRRVQLKENLMDTLTEDLRPAAGRRNPKLRVLLPLALAAAVAGVALTTAPGRDATPSPGGRSFGSIVNAAYTLEQSGDDLIELTILEDAKPGDPAQLQRDLDRVGVRSRVYAGEPGCDAPLPALPTFAPETSAKAEQDWLAAYGWDIRPAMTPAGHREVLAIRPGVIRADLTLYIYLPLAKTNPQEGFRHLEAGLMQSPAPDCMPTQSTTRPPARTGSVPSPTPKQ